MKRIEYILLTTMTIALSAGLYTNICMASNEEKAEVSAENDTPETETKSSEGAEEPDHVCWAAGTSSCGISAVRTDGRYCFTDADNHKLDDQVYEAVRYIDEADSFVMRTGADYGAADAKGSTIIPMQFDWIEYDAGVNVFEVCDGVCLGLLDKTGKTVCDVSYENIITDENSDFYLAERDGEWECRDYDNQLLSTITIKNNAGLDSGVIFDRADSDEEPLMYNSSGEKIQDYYAVHSGTLDDDYVIVEKNGKVGYCVLKNDEMEEKVPFEYDQAWPFYNGKAIVQKNDEFLLIDEDNNILSVLPVDDVESDGIHQGIYTIRKNEKYGFMDSEGKIFIPARYDGGSILNEQYYAIRVNGDCGVIDKDGNVCIPIKYLDIDIIDEYDNTLYDNASTQNEDDLDKREQLLCVSDGQLKGVFSPDGKEIIPAEYGEVSYSGYFDCILTRVADGVNYWTTEGKKADLFNGEVGTIFLCENENIIIAKCADKSYAYDKDLRLLWETDLAVEDFSSGYACASKNNCYGFVNTKGETVIPLEYSYVYPFDAETGVAQVVKNGKTGFINEAGELVVDCVYDGVLEGFRYGKAVVSGDDFFGIINPAGERLFSLSDCLEGENYHSIYLGRNKIEINGFEKLYVLNNCGEVIKKEIINASVFSDDIGLIPPEITDYPGEERVIEWADSGMEKYIRAAIGCPEGDITNKDLWNIRYLSINAWDNNGGEASVYYDAEGYLYNAPETYPQLKGVEILSLEDLRWMPNLEKITLEGLHGLKDINGMENLGNLTELSINSCDELTDISALEDLENLTELTLWKLDDLEDIKVLGSLNNLTDLTIKFCDDLEDISPLDGLENLTNLSIHKCENLVDVSVLEKLINLVNLSLDDCKKLKDIRVLGNLKNLISLSLYGDESLTDINSLGNLGNLTSLTLSYCENITDISVLSSLKNLEYLAVDSTGVTDFSPVENMQDLELMK